jgi:hypothetical protein
MDDSAETGQGAEAPKKFGRGMNPNSQKNLNRGREAGEAQESRQALGYHDETMLEAMRWVSQHKGSEDTTVQQGEMRRWMNGDRNGFMRYRASLEAKALAGRGSSPSQTSTGGSQATHPVGHADPARARVGESLGAEIELLEFVKANRAAILEYMAKREAFLAWEAERAAAVAG